MGKGLNGWVPNHAGQVSRLLSNSLQVFLHLEDFNGLCIQGAEMAITMRQSYRVTGRDSIEIESCGHATVREVCDKIAHDPISWGRLPGFFINFFKNLVD